MFNKLIRIAGYIAYGLLAALFGGYLLAGIICIALAWLLSLIGFTITATDIIGSTFGLVILLACMAFTFMLGVGIGVAVQHGIDKIFGGGEN